IPKCSTTMRSSRRSGKRCTTSRRSVPATRPTPTPMPTCSVTAASGRRSGTFSAAGADHGGHRPALPPPTGPNPLRVDDPEAGAGYTPALSEGPAPPVRRLAGRLAPAETHPEGPHVQGDEGHQPRQGDRDGARAEAHPGRGEDRDANHRESREEHRCEAGREG